MIYDYTYIYCSIIEYTIIHCYSLMFWFLSWKGPHLGVPEASNARGTGQAEGENLEENVSIVSVYNLHKKYKIYLKENRMSNDEIW